MKKFVAVAAMIVLGATLAFARTSRASRGGSSHSGSSKDLRSVHAIGFDVPIWNQTWEDAADWPDFDWSAVGFNFMYHHLSVAPSRFSTFIDVELGYTSFSLDEINGSSVEDVYESFGGFNTRYMFGLGGAPVVTDSFTLAVHGTFGVNMAIAGNTQSDNYYNGTGSYIGTYDTDMWLFDFWTTIGVNVDAAYKITGNFGVFAGINMYINLFGCGLFSTEVSSINYSESDFWLIYPGNFNIDFRLGVAFVY